MLKCVDLLQRPRRYNARTKGYDYISLPPTSTMNLSEAVIPTQTTNQHSVRKLNLCVPNIVIPNSTPYSNFISAVSPTEPIISASCDIYHNMINNININNHKTSSTGVTPYSIGTNVSRDVPHKTSTVSSLQATNNAANAFGLTTLGDLVCRATPFSSVNKAIEPTSISTVGRHVTVMPQLHPDHDATKGRTNFCQARANTPRFVNSEAVFSLLRLPISLSDPSPRAGVMTTPTSSKHDHVYIDGASDICSTVPRQSNSSDTSGISSIVHNETTITTALVKKPLPYLLSFVNRPNRAKHQIPTKPVVMKAKSQNVIPIIGTQSLDKFVSIGVSDTPVPKTCLSRFARALSSILPADHVPTTPLSLSKLRDADSSSEDTDFEPSWCGPSVSSKPYTTSVAHLPSPSISMTSTIINSNSSEDEFDFEPSVEYVPDVANRNTNATGISTGMMSCNAALSYFS